MENCLDAAAAERLKCLSLQDSFWTSLLVTHVPKYSVELSPQSKQKHPHTSTDYPGTQTLSNIPQKKALSLPCWAAQPQQQRQLCPDHPALLVWEGQMPLHLSGSSWGAGLSSGCRISLLMQLKDFWILVLLVFFQPESAAISSQTSCVQPEQCKGILRGYNLF